MPIPSAGRHTTVVTAGEVMHHPELQLLGSPATGALAGVGTAVVLPRFRLRRKPFALKAARMSWRITVVQGSSSSAFAVAMWRWVLRYHPPNWPGLECRMLQKLGQLVGVCRWLSLPLHVDVA